jgi:hypothetical protein
MDARSRGLATTALVAGIALAVAVMAVWVWPSSAGETESDAPEADVTAPVGRMGDVSAGHNTGGATDHPIELPDYHSGDYFGRPGTGSITGPIGGLAAAHGVPSEASEVSGVATPRASTGAGLTTPTVTRNR